MNTSKKIFQIIFIALLTSSCLFQISCGDSKTDNGISEQIQTPDPVKYEIIDEWNIPNGGKGKVILIDIGLTNITGLKKLGECLNYENKDERNAFITVFNDKKAAEMYHDAANLNDIDGAFYDKHFLAVYNKNINTNYNQIQIHEDGLDGKSTDVKY
jgi:hypothetical protein